MGLKFPQSRIAVFDLLKIFSNVVDKIIVVFQ